MRPAEPSSPPIAPAGPGCIVLVVSTTSYRADAFLEASRRVGAEVLIASDRCHVLDKHWTWPASSLVIDFYDPEAAAQTIAQAGLRSGSPVRAVVPAEGEAAALVAAMASEALDLPANAVSATAAAGNKCTMRTLCRAAGVPTPRFVCFALDEDPTAAATRTAREIGWPCVLKPLLLSGSRGVVRADNTSGFCVAFARLRRLLQTPELLELHPTASRQILCESFIPGPEVALEGLLTDGVLRTLALFDKPDPLDGPFFEETIYVTPSRLSPAIQESIQAATAAAAAALGLRTGPVHAELRLPPDGPPIVIEVAARTIGGLCARTLRFGTGLSLEELVLRHALGQDVAALQRQGEAAGVMMIPIPGAGVLKTVEGLDDAQKVPGVEDVVISVRPGERLLPLPEGSSYLGFIFARGQTPTVVETALREAHARLSFSITPTLPRSTGE
jgi:biotin carboxylase